MEFVDGNTLAGLAEEHDNGRLEAKTATGFIRQCAEALSFIHGMDIIHRDIKPANILISKSGVAKLADLGLAKQMDAGDTAGLTMQGMALGSPAYMPPEQIRNARDASRPADIYALGATFYQVVSGKLPFDGKSSTDVLTKVLREQPESLAILVPGLPANVRKLIENMMEKDAAKRPQTADDLMKLIDNLDKPPTKRIQPTTKSIKKKSGCFGLMLLAVSLVGGLFYALH